MAFGVLAAALAAFFRDPDRRPDHSEPAGPDIVLAPADGRIMWAGPGQPDVAPAGDWLQVSIFLSVTDVHINRTPYGGRVESVTHRPGRYRAAYSAESANENERSEITVVRDLGGRSRTVVFRQVVGVMARRVVTRVRVGDQLAAGQRVGLMRFGSRMDVFVDPSATLEVAVGERTVAGETVLARWPVQAQAVG